MNAPGIGEQTILADKYRLDALIGEGGMRLVPAAATHLILDRTVAVKVIRGSDLDASTVERFKREARHAASIHHPNVIEVIDFGVSAEGAPYLVMEYLEGDNLAERLARTPPPSIGDVVAWLLDALEGLAAVHDAGILHRDLKPANLFLARAGRRVGPQGPGLRSVAQQSADGQRKPRADAHPDPSGAWYAVLHVPGTGPQRPDRRPAERFYSIGVILTKPSAGGGPSTAPTPRRSSLPSSWTSRRPSFRFGATSRAASPR